MLNEWYLSHIDRHIQEGTWPYIRVPIAGRYIELEIAGGSEYQERIWIGNMDGSCKTLLGYHSGHFSLPALRLKEVSWIAEQTDQLASALLWLSGAYLESGESARALARRLVSAVPGLAISKRDAMATAILEELMVDELKWTRDAKFGWINNWAYSQRNPSSKLSILQAEDFAYINEYFSELTYG